MALEPKKIDWNKCAWTTLRDKVRYLSFQGSDAVTVTLDEVTPGHVPGSHRHDYEQLIFILQGECDFYVDGVPHHLTAGCLMAIPPNVEHCMVAKGEIPVIDVDIFMPKRISDRPESRVAEDPSKAVRFGNLFTPSS
ncbi:cupin domain-containing protein [Candidatus Formimonas warabiya]|uniref:Cupin type-2 domain-containing protein n=1 Tax=Formimonas warabiya TaxID=1761012 RepID=A0A3G1KQN5_FORW1|nr:cupin domain-containing protein [Candidatus Formimonas warabiya]ATW24747.1 hypothetical protein DCMF_08135 [Candidatus Formimonas warabiya]